ncbi:MAG: hypothetical protein R6V46_06645, partial [Desulfatiglandaceae bacterium]
LSLNLSLGDPFIMIPRCDTEHVCNPGHVLALKPRCGRLFWKQQLFSIPYCHLLSASWIYVSPRLSGSGFRDEIGIPG